MEDARMPRKLAILALATLPALVTGAGARPWINVATFSGPTCVVQQGPAAYGTGFVTFAPGQIGTIVLNCEFNERDIFSFQDNFPGLPVYGQLTYRDSSGTGTSASVTVRVITNRLTASDTVNSAGEHPGVLWPRQLCAGDTQAHADHRDRPVPQLRVRRLAPPARAYSTTRR
jgi:hypothetical protein